MFRFYIVYVSNYFSESARLEKFRVNSAGFENRYRGRADEAPHVDGIYKVMYPNEKNSDYTCDQVRNNRRENVMNSKYDIRRRVNGDFDIQVLVEAGGAEAPKGFSY